MCVCVQKEAPPLCHSKSRHEVKLMEKIPERAEATVVLVGMNQLHITTSPQLHEGKSSSGLFSSLRCVCRQCGLPGPALHGVCATTRGGSAGVRPGGSCPRQVPLPPTGTADCQHRLPPDRALYLHPHVRQGQSCRVNAI